VNCILAAIPLFLSSAVWRISDKAMIIMNNSSKLLCTILWTVVISPASADDQPPKKQIKSTPASRAYSATLSNSWLAQSATEDPTTTAAALKQTASAEADANASSMVLDPITVTGELQERTLQDSQTSVSVIPGETLDESSDIRLYDVIERTPNVNSVFGEKGFAIRGISQNGFGGGGGRLVNVNVDGASLPTAQSTFFGPYSTWDLDQVEVLRGPQSTQQGRNALAGAIKIRSADPIFEREVKLRTDVATFDSYRVAVAVNTPLIPNTLAGRLAFDRYSSDGWVENPTRDEEDYDGRDLTLARGKLLFEPNDALRTVLSYSYTDNSGGEDVVAFEQFPEDRFNFSDEQAREGSIHRIATLNIDYTLSERWAVSSETTYYVHDYERLEDADNSPTPGNRLRRETDDNSLTQELLLRFDNEDNLRGVIGVYYTRIDSTQDTSAILPGTILDPALAGATITTRFDDDTDTENVALFGEIDYGFFERWTLTVGARYDRETEESIDRSSRAIDPPVIDLPSIEPVDTDTTFDAFLPKLGITYDWTNDFSTGFTVQRGYRAGGAQRNLVTGELNEFDPEFTWNYELALRSNWLNQRLTVNANVFYTDWTDQQVSVFGPSGIILDTNTVNAGESELYGFEIDVQARLTNNLDTFAALGFVHTEFTDFVSGTEDFSGNEFEFAPNVTATFGSSYFFPHDWVLHADVSYTDEQFTDNANRQALEVDDRFLVNARFGYEGDTWSAYVYSRNLFDQNYVTQFADEERSLTRTGEPRIIGLQVNAQF
jgi:TonB-dependent siderophore receptor